MAEFKINGLKPELTLKNAKNNSNFFVYINELMAVRDYFNGKIIHLILFPETFIIESLTKQMDEKYFVPFKKENNIIYILDSGINDKLFVIKDSSFFDHLKFSEDRKFYQFSLDLNIIEKSSILVNVQNSIPEVKVTMKKLKQERDAAVKSENYVLAREWQNKIDERVLKGEYEFTIDELIIQLKKAKEKKNNSLIQQIRNKITERNGFSKKNKI